ncbi:MAG: invasion associated locus B family protein [Acuticoccus sp.]
MDILSRLAVSVSRRQRLCAALVVALAVIRPPVASGATEPDALTERYRDWTVQCATPDNGARRCWMMQTLTQEKSGQRILQVELTLAGGNPLMMLLTPLGLLLPEGAQLTIDDGAPRTVAFRTCLPRGCIAQETASEASLANLRRGQTLTVALTPLNGDAALTLGVSLAGFSAAYDRLAALAGG